MFPSFLRVARFSTIAFSVASVSGNAVNGVCIVTTTVVAPFAVTFFTDGQKIEFSPELWIAEDVEVRGHRGRIADAPLWKWRFGRSLNVHVRRFFETVHEANSDGWYRPAASRTTGYS